MARAGHPWLRTFGTIAIIFGVAAFWVLRPVRETDFSTGGFIPIRENALAARHAPVFIRHPLYGAPSRLLYRMAKSPAGEIHIAYHPFYAAEENPHEGFGAELNRLIYTGAYGLKNRMFGPADIELIEVILDVQGKPRRLFYEDAQNYNPKNFSVYHLPVNVTDPVLPLCFGIRSWNHLVSLKPPADCKSAHPLVPEYFSEEEWLKYKMVKKSEAILRRNRAHRQYERVVAQ